MRGLSKRQGSWWGFEVGGPRSRGVQVRTGGGRRPTAQELDDGDARGQSEQADLSLHGLHSWGMAGLPVTCHPVSGLRSQILLVPWACHSSPLKCLCLLTGCVTSCGS